MLAGNEPFGSRQHRAALVGQHQDVGAAVVLSADASVTDKELRAFCATRLAQFKVPRTIVFLDEIPKGATGKLQRIGLAQKLGLGGGPKR